MQSETTIQSQTPRGPRADLYTQKEAAQYLRVSEMTLLRARKAGKITFMRIQGKVFYTTKMLESYLEANTFTAAAAA